MNWVDAAVLIVTLPIWAWALIASTAATALLLLFVASGTRKSIPKPPGWVNDAWIYENHVRVLPPEEHRTWP